MAEALLIEENVPTTKTRRLISKLGLESEENRDALASALNLTNPFPDDHVRRVGWPDSKSVPSVVLVDTQEVSVSKSSSLGAGAWDFHACILPTAFTSMTAANVQISAAGTGLATGIGNIIAPYNIVQADAGGLMDPLDSLSLHTYNGAYGQLANGSMFRVVAQGLEVVNTSAQLYKGGMAYGYRLPGSYADVGLLFQGAIPVSGAMTFLNGSACGRPPETVNDIINYGNTSACQAADGIYVINTPSSERNEPEVNAGGICAFVRNPGALVTNAVVVSGVGHQTQWNMCGAFLTGLAPEATFVVRFRTYIEIFPLPRDNNNLIRLTNPTVAHSPIVSELLCMILRDMPAGCPYTMNPLGEWFEHLMEKIADFAPTIGSAFGPAGSLIGAGVSHLAKGAGALNANSRMASQKKKKVLTSASPKKPLKK